MLPEGARRKSVNNTRDNFHSQRRSPLHLDAYADVANAGRPCDPLLLLPRPHHRGQAPTAATGEDGEEERSQGAAAPMPLDPSLTADNQFIVSEIVDFREKPRLQYLCKWLGYPDSEKTW